MIRKGIVLAGGSGNRLWPLTRVLNKHLIPVYNYPMIYYPIKTLTDAHIDDILIVTGREHAERFIELLGSGSEFNIDFTYKIQDDAKGIAHALRLAKRFANGDSVAVILGDNIFEDKFDFSTFREGARIFIKRISDPQRFGVARIRYNVKEEKSKVIEVVEKPKFGDTDNELIDKNGWGFAVTGLYLYDSRVFDIISCLKPSERGELEISDVNNTYIKEERMDYDIVKGFWSDAGTFSSLFKASEFVKDSYKNKR